MALQEELETQGNFLFKYRGVLPVIILLVGLAVYLIPLFQGQSLPLDENWFYFLCFSVSILGLLVRIYTIAYSADNTSGRNTEKQVADDLNTTGIYSMVRHPLYVGNFLMWLGIGMLTQNAWFTIAFVFIYWVYYERIMFAEEQFLRRKFGDAYLKWSEKTPAFVPSLSNFEKPKFTFNWRKVIIKEINGLMNTFIVFSLFQITGSSITNQAFALEKNFWTLGLATCLISYVIIKIIRKSTSLLREERQATSA